MRSYLHTFLDEIKHLIPTDGLAEVRQRLNEVDWEIDATEERATEYGEERGWTDCEESLKRDAAEKDGDAAHRAGAELCFQRAAEYRESAKAREVYEYFFPE